MWELLSDPRCHYYVCGDGKMADGAYEALLKLIQKHGHMSRVAAVMTIDKMRVDKRYHLYVWGLVLHYQSAKNDALLATQQAAKQWMAKLISGDF